MAEPAVGAIEATYPKFTLIGLAGLQTVEPRRHDPIIVVRVDDLPPAAIIRAFDATRILGGRPDKVQRFRTDINELSVRVSAPPMSRHALLNRARLSLWWEARFYHGVLLADCDA